MYILCHELLCYLYFLQTKSFISIMLIKIYIHILVHSNTLTQNQIHHTLNLIYTHQPYYHTDISKHINTIIHNQHKHFVHNIARLHQHVNNMKCYLTISYFLYITISILVNTVLFIIT